MSGLDMTNFTINVTLLLVIIGLNRLALGQMHATVMSTSQQHCKDFICKALADGLLTDSPITRVYCTVKSKSVINVHHELSITNANDDDKLIM